MGHPPGTRLRGLTGIRRNGWGKADVKGPAGWAGLQKVRQKGVEYLGLGAGKWDGGGSRAVQEGPEVRGQVWP